MAEIVVKNLTGGSLELNGGGVSYTLPQGSADVDLDVSSLTIERADSSTFTVPIEHSRHVITVGATTWESVGGSSIQDNYFEGMGFGVVVMFTVLALRMVITLGYHSQDI